MSTRKPKIAPPIATPTTPTQATPLDGSSQGDSLSGAFSAFSFAPRLQAFAQNRAGRRSLIGGGS